MVVVTPTASGKSLCYTVPVLQALAEDPSARALFLFPTKALSQDQVAEFGELVLDAGLEVSAACYDGDTPAPIRSAVRKAGQVVVTNPDMLHSAILPHHTKWFQLFEQLRVIVIDELHTYRGVFGSHVANVLRRLLRLCAHYGSNPVIVCCSATIGNPGELAAQLTGRPMRLIDRNGAPSGEKHLLLVDPPILDPATGARGSALTLAQRWALPFLRAGRQTVVFGKSRVAVEIMLSNLRETLRADLGPRSRIRGYRGGLPADGAAVDRARAARRRGARRREHERPGARASTSAGSTWRCSRATRARSPATWQQMGRAGRRGEVSVAILVAVAGAGRPVRDPPPRVHPRRPARRRRGSTPTTCTSCSPTSAARRSSCRSSPASGSGRVPPTTCSRSWARAGTVRQADDGRWYWSSENFPASEVSLRAAAPENVVIIDTTPDRPRVLGEVDLFAAQVLVHQHAIYLHESVQYHVDRLEWGERKAYVHRIDADHYTYANRAVTLKPLDVFAEAPAAGGRRVHGEVMVVEPRHAVQEAQVRHRRERRLGPDRPAGDRAPDDRVLAHGGARADRLAARRAGRRADRRGTGDPGGRRGPADGRPAGPRARVAGPLAAPRGADDLPVRGDAGRRRAVGAAVRTATPSSWTAPRTCSRACPCEAGCPACTGPRLEPEVDGKALALRLLAALGAGVAPGERPPVAVA